MMDVDKPVDDVLARPVRPVLYNSSNYQEQLKQLSRVQFISRTRHRRPQIKNISQALDTDLIVNTELIPHLRSKHLADTPKFLFSLERKKLRIRNGMQSRGQMSSRVERREFRSEKVKRVQQKQGERCRHTHKIHTAKPFQWNLVPQLAQKDKAELPHFLFNIHHMADRQYEFGVEELQRRTAKGANTMYYGCSSAQRSRRNSVHSSRSCISTGRRSRLRQTLFPVE